MVCLINTLSVNSLCFCSNHTSPRDGKVSTLNCLLWKQKNTLLWKCVSFRKLDQASGNWEGARGQIKLGTPRAPGCGSEYDTSSEIPSSSSESGGVKALTFSFPVVQKQGERRVWCPQHPKHLHGVVSEP